MDLLSEYPQLLQKDREGLWFDGYITVYNQRYRLEIQIPQTQKLGDANLNCDWRLQQVLSSHRHIIKQRLKQCDNLLSFLKELQSIVERQLEGKETSQSSTSKFCSQLITDVEALGWDKLVYINPAFTQLHLKYEDAGNRCHVIQIQIGSKYPEEAPLCSTELPSKFDIHWTTQKKNLIDKQFGSQNEIKHVYTQFVEAVNTYQNFWDTMFLLDKNTWVLEPEKPNFSARHRRIAITSIVSVQITVDPVHPTVLPECKFLGSDQAIGPVRKSMNSNIHMWDEKGDLLSNLQAVLDVTFPSPTNSRKEEFSGECGICYAYRMEAEIPDEVCNDTRCGQAFHKTCLVEWLRALPSSRQSFNTIFGNCPYCEKPITVKMVIK